MNATTISSVTFLVKNFPNLTRIAYFFFFPSQHSALASQPARPPRRREVDPMWPSPVPLCCLWLPPVLPVPGSRTRPKPALTCSPFAGGALSYLKAFAQAATAFLSSTGCPSQPSLSLSLVGPYLTLEAPRLKYLLLKKASCPEALQPDLPSPARVCSRAEHWLESSHPGLLFIKSFSTWTMNSLRAGTGFLLLRRLTVVNKVTDEQMEDVNSTIPPKSIQKPLEQIQVTP